MATGGRNGGDDRRSRGRVDGPERGDLSHGVPVSPTPGRSTSSVSTENVNA